MSWHRAAIHAVGDRDLLLGPLARLPNVPPRNASVSISAGVPAFTASDAALVQLVKSRHVHAARWLHDRFARDITRIVFRILGGDADQEDMVHEIFMKIWALIGAGKVREPEALGSWVFSVATNILYKELRRRYVRRRFLRHHEQTPEGVHRMQDEEARDLLLAVHRILAEMPPAERLVFGLRYLDRRTVAELATLCGYSLGTAKRRLRKAEHTFTNLARRHGDYPALRSLVSDQKGRG